MNMILFDANSTSPISALLAIAPGDCILINSWGLAPGETAQVYRALVALGSIPEQQAGSCLPPPQVTAAAIVNETPYFPCNVPLEVGQAPNQNLTSIVIQQPGFYRVHLTPSALGTAYVEAVVLTGSEACAAAARQCCCVPEAWWEGSSTNPCFTITPGGEAGHAPVFSLDACCLLHAFPALPDPVDTDELVVLSGGACFRSTIAQVFDPAIICTTLGSYLLQPPAVGDTVVVVDAGANCIRRDGETFVEFFETPWTGISVTPALTIAAGGINGHGPTFAYDLCADVQALASCACEPNPGDQLLIVQGGACVLASWPVTNFCDQMGALPMGALIAGDTVLVRELGGACKQVDAASIAFDGGTINNPILGPDGSCAAPTYSFTSSPDSGMFYDPAVGVDGGVVIGDDNCTDFIEIGASVTLNAATSFVILRGGYTAPGSACGLIVETNAIERLRIGSNGAWNLNTLGGGNPGDVITSAGPGSPPQWAPAGGGGVAEPITQIVYGTGPSVDSDPFFIFNLATGAFGVNATAGGGRPAGIAGPTAVRIYGRDATNNGANIEILGGNANVVGGSGGGGILSQGGLGGQFGNGGTNEVRGGNTTFIGRNGGLVTIFGGNNTNGVADTGNNGGGVDVIGGDAGTGSRQGGNVRVLGGNDGGMTFGTSSVTLAFNGVPGNGTSITLFANPSTTSRWTGGTGVPAVTKGQDIQIEAGSGDSATLTSDSGDLFLGTGIRGGHPAGTGEYGHIVLYGATSPVGRPLANINATTGDVCLAGSGGPAPGSANTTLPAATTGGFTWLPRIAANPTGVPNGVNWQAGAFSAYANPVTIEQEGGQTCIWVYNFTAAAWHSTCFNAGGAIASPAFPLLAPDGSCAAPSYSFTTDTDSGLWYDPSDGGKVTLSNDNCRDKIVLGSTNAANALAIFLQAGFGAAGTTGGGIYALGGDCSDGNQAGSITLEAGRHATVSGQGGSIILIAGLSAVAGAGGDVTMTTGSSPNKGGGWSVFMGAGNTGLASNSAEAVFSWPGVPGSTNFGKWALQGGGGNILSMDNAGDITFHGTAGAAGTKHILSNRDFILGRTDLVAAATGGFPFIPRLAAAPTGVPTNYGGTSPIVIQETGAGALTLWSYNYADATWHSVSLP